MSKLFAKIPNLKKVFEQTVYKDTASLDFLHGLVKSIKPRFVLELGTGKGCSAAFMALALPKNGVVVTIDNYLRPDITTRELVAENLSSCGLLDKIDLIEGSTFEAGDLFKRQYGANARAEIVFMDSSHVAVNLRREYDVIKSVLSESHYLVIDDAFYNDIHDFLKGLLRDGRYESYRMYPYHQGLAVFSSKGA